MTVPCNKNLRRVRVPRSRNSGGFPWSGGTPPLQSKNWFGSNPRITRLIWPFFVRRSHMCMGLTSSGLYLQRVNSPSIQAAPEGIRPKGSWILVCKMLVLHMPYHVGWACAGDPRMQRTVRHKEGMPIAPCAGCFQAAPPSYPP